MINDYYIINTHVHIFPEKIASKAVKGTDTFYGTTSVFDGTSNGIKSEMEEIGIDKSIVCSVATTKNQVSSINSFINDEVKASRGKFVGLGAMYPGSDTLEEDILESVNYGFKGIKIHPDIQNFKVDCDGLLKIYSLCEKYNLVVLLHTGDYRYDNSNPNRLVDVVKTFKNVTFIGAHFGGWSIQDEASKRLSIFDNFFVDTSSSFYYMDDDLAKRVYSRYGEDRVMFATDYPMWRGSDELKYIEKLHLNNKEKEKIFSKNAIKVFGF